MSDLMEFPGSWVVIGIALTLVFLYYGKLEKMAETEFAGYMWLPSYLSLIKGCKVIIKFATVASFLVAIGLLALEYFIQ